MNGSPAVNLVILALSVVVAVVAYRSSERFKKKNGVTPWHWPSWLWAVVGLVSFLLCLILFLIASRRTTPVLGPAPGAAFGAAPPSPAVPAYTHLSADQNGWGQGSGPAVAGPNVPLPPGAWHADPAGRYASRYWDGTAWTEHVSDGQTSTTDRL